MSKEQDKIVDNPSAKELLEGIKGAEALRFIYNVIPGAKKAFPNLEEAFSKLDELKEQAEILYLPDKFNEHFASRGWIAYESLNVEIIKDAISLAAQGNYDEAEDILANYYNEENLRWMILRLQGIKEFRPRLRLIELAKEDYLAERYHACIPLLLALIDGLVNDISKHVGFFAERSELTAWNSIAAHKSGLQSIAAIFNSNRTKTTEEQITIPYRNGILHGRDLAFDNKLVAAKCWSTIFAVRDWSAAINDGGKEPQSKENKSLIEVFNSYNETLKLGRRLDEWKPRIVKAGIDWPAEGPSEVIFENTPERIAVEFIENWKSNRYGKMAESLVDCLNTPFKKKAGQVRKDFGHVRPAAYKIIEVKDEAPAISNVKMSITYNQDGAIQSKEVVVRVVYQDKDSNPLLRGEDGGKWKVIQASFSDIIYNFK